MRVKILAAASILALMTGAAGAQDAGASTDTTASGQGGTATTDTTTVGTVGDVGVSTEAETGAGTDTAAGAATDTDATATAGAAGDAATGQAGGFDPMMAQAQLGGMNPDEVIGHEIETADGQSIGTVEDLLVDPETNQIGQVVIALSDGAGLGERQVAVPFENLTFAADDRIMLSGMEVAELGDLPDYEADGTMTSFATESGLGAEAEAQADTGTDVDADAEGEAEAEGTNN